MRNVIIKVIVAVLIFIVAIYSWWWIIDSCFHARRGSSGITTEPVNWKGMETPVTGTLTPELAMFEAGERQRREWDAQHEYPGADELVELNGVDETRLIHRWRLIETLQYARPTTVGDCTDESPGRDATFVLFRSPQADGMPEWTFMLDMTMMEFKDWYGAQYEIYERQKAGEEQDEDRGDAKFESVELDLKAIADKGSWDWSDLDPGLDLAAEACGIDRARWNPPDELLSERIFLIKGWEEGGGLEITGSTYGPPEIDVEYGSADYPLPLRFFADTLPDAVTVTDIDGVTWLLPRGQVAIDGFTWGWPSDNSAWIVGVKALAPWFGSGEILVTAAEADRVRARLDEIDGMKDTSDPSRDIDTFHAAMAPRIPRADDPIKPLADVREADD